MNGFSYLPSPGSLNVAAANMSPMVLWLLELDWYAGHATSHDDLYLHSIQAEKWK